MSISDFAELELLDHITGIGAYTAPTTLYVKLHTGDPGEAGTSNAATETTRQASSWTGPASSGAVSTDADIVWTSVSTTETYSHISVWDHATAGNHIWYGALDASKAVTSGDTFTIASGDLTLSLN